MKKTKKDRLLRVLKRRWLTPLEAVGECGLFSLSQRCGELRRSADLRREGYRVIDKWVHLPSGSRVKAFRVVPTKGGA